MCLLSSFFVHWPNCFYKINSFSQFIFVLSFVFLSLSIKSISILMIKWWYLNIKLYSWFWPSSFINLKTRLLHFISVTYKARTIDDVSSNLYTCKCIYYNDSDADKKNRKKTQHANNVKCCRLGSIERVHGRYWKMQVTVHAPVAPSKFCWCLINNDWIHGNDI
jgi:hypothetical protein